MWTRVRVFWLIRVACVIVVRWCFCVIVIHRCFCVIIICVGFCVTLVCEQVMWHGNEPKWRKVFLDTNMKNQSLCGRWRSSKNSWSTAKQRKVAIYMHDHVHACGEWMKSKLSICSINFVHDAPLLSPMNHLSVFVTVLCAKRLIDTWTGWCKFDALGVDPECVIVE